MAPSAPRKLHHHHNQKDVNGIIFGSPITRSSATSSTPKGSTGGISRLPDGTPAGVSDYESDANYLEPSVSASALALALQPEKQDSRTINDMNLAVLRRYDPTIQGYSAMSHNATLYKMKDRQWEESGFKGPLFVCIQTPDLSTGHITPRACIFVLNRLALENAIIDLTTVVRCELQDQLLIAVTNNKDVLGLHLDAESAGKTWSHVLEQWEPIQDAKQLPIRQT
ncbi:mRNA-decapping enzyme 1B [Cytospora mali]|uniref:mRNA-decapping enzyme 1B n=1 Tax=Cytospora mali TaxID=578113 RepID=A0A194VG97_CYTMA|nr:mRNA-decapping enzyme 1B [Valsa mali var. pyri (nom. inval.)]